MKNFITLAVSLFSLSIFGQVGINNAAPNATLHVNAKTTDGSRPEGFIAPRLTGDQIKAGDAQYGTAQKGAIIYATSATASPTAKTINITSEGYYFFDGVTWQKISGAAAADTTNDAWINDDANSMVKLGTNANGTARATGADFVARDNGSVGIGTGNPDASAVLDISASNKGMLIPRVALTSITDITTIPSPATGLMVYNTGTAALTYKGFVFWNGTEWRQIDDKSLVNPVITGLNCNTASVSPAAFTSGTPYTGTLTVYYSGGNGGSYSGGTTFTQNGLTFTLDQGVLNKGNGFITYSVTGTPNFSSPTTITVPLSFLGFSCNATIGLNSTPFVIGEIRSARIMVNTASFTANGGSRNVMTGKAVGNTSTTDRRAAYEVAANDEKVKFIIINGLRMDFLESDVNGNVSPKFYNTTASAVSYNITSLSTFDQYISGVGTSIASGHYSYLIDGDNNFNATVADQAEYVNAMVTFPNGEWYNCTWHATRDATNHYFYITAQRLN